jgi:hypothetical protein
MDISAIGDDAQDYATMIGYIQKEVKKRGDVVEVTFRWPKSAQVWESGIVGSITSTTMTDGSKAWEVSPQKRWYGYDDAADPSITPVYYDLIIEVGGPKDEYKVVRARVTDNTATTLTLSPYDIPNYVTAGWIDSVSDCSGKQYYLIGRKASNYGLWWHDRVISFPNDEEKLRGTISSYTSTTIVDTDNSFGAEYVGDEILFYTADGELKRLEITAVDGSTLSVSLGSDTASGDYSIVKAGNRCTPTRRSGQLAVWYRGRNEAVTSYDPDDNLSSTLLPQYQMLFSDSGDCSESYITVFDRDIIAALDSPCSNADEFYCPNIYKSIHGLQMAVEDLSIHFVPMHSYVGWDALDIETYTVAQCFDDAGINSFTTSATAGETETEFAISLPYLDDITIYWTMLHGNEIVDSGTASDFADETLTLTTGGDLEGETITLVYSYGWTRKLPREFRHWYDATFFVPTDEEAGSYTTRGKSEAYRETGVLGVVYDSDEFVEADNAIYVGDNHNDPFPDSGVSSEFAPYWATTYEGVYSQANQSEVYFSMRGVCTGGSSVHLETDKDWFDTFPNSIVHTETGTASSGSTNTLTDSSKSGEYWEDDRGFYIGFMLVMTSGDNNGLRRPIVSKSGTTLTVSPAFPNTIDSGDTYKVVFPQVLNRWKDRTVEIALNDGSGVTVEALITHSDDSTLWFADCGYTITSGASFFIRQAVVGKVYTRTSGEWVLADVDTLPDMITRYGRDRKGDIRGNWVWEELAQFINCLYWTKSGVSVTPREDDEVEEKNFKSSLNGRTGEAFPDFTSWAAVKAYYTSWYNSVDFFYEEAPTEIFLNPIEQSGTPRCDGRASWTYEGAFDNPTDLYGATFERKFGYYVTTTPLNPNYGKTVDYAVFGWLDSDDTPVTDGVETTDLFKNEFIFNANGDTIQYHAWDIFDSTVGTTEGELKSGKFGSHTVPELTEPTAVDLYFGQVKEGYYVGNSCAIVKWAFDE